MRLQEPTEGTVTFEDQDVLSLSNRDLRNLRKDMQMIYQDPFGSLNPRFSIGQSIGEMYDIHQLYKGKEKEQKIQELLEYVGLDPTRMNHYHMSFLGGKDRG